MSPPPWTLTGRGWIALYRQPGLSPLGALLLVRYDTSGVGAYDELMWVDAPVPSPFGKRARIRRIVVSTQESVDWGRRNWAIPKTRADFEWAPGQVRVTDETGLLAHLTFGESRGKLGVSDAVIPPPLRTVVQPALDGKAGWKATCFRVRGRVGPGRLGVVQAPGFPHAEATRPVLTVAVSAFQMVFPVPAVRRG